VERLLSTASESTSTIAAYALAIAATLEQHGVPPETVFERCDITLPATTDPMLRFSQEEINQLFAEAIKATANPCFGLAVAAALHPGNLHAVGYALLASNTLRDFSERLRNYYRLAAQVIDIDLAERDGEFLLVTRVTIDDICWETQDAYAALMVRFMRFIYKPDFSPLRLSLIRPEPVACRPQFDDYFHCEISFDNPDLVIVLPSDIIDLPLPGACKELAQIHDNTAMDYLSRLDKADIVNRVRKIVVEDLLRATVPMERVAEKLCMSSRSLQGKLADRGTSFQEILDSTREGLALGYIEQSNLSITEAAYMLGFSEAANFTRAFKRWTGKSPREYREEKGIEK